MGWPAVSAVRFLEAAAENEVPIYVLDAGNFSQLAPQLQLPAHVMASISQTIREGKAAVVPKEALRLADRLDVGWIELDPQTGGAAFLISRGEMGGSTLYRVRWIFPHFTLPPAMWSGRSRRFALRLVISKPFGAELL